MKLDTPSSWSTLSAIVVGTVAVGFVQSLITKSLLANPINVKIIPDPEKKKENPKYEEEPEPELLNNVPGPWGDEPPVVGTPQTDSKPPPRFTRYEQVWDKEQQEYVEYTEPPPRRVPDDEELLNWFKIYSRRPSMKKDAKPTISVELISQSLINFLRTAYGGGESFNNRPLINVHQLFPLKERFTDLLRLMQPSELETTKFEAKQALGGSVGIPDALNDDMDEPSLLKHFRILSRQLEKLVDFLNEEFEKIQEELAMYLSHGQIAFHLLGYLHQPGTKLLLEGGKDKMAMRMTACHYQTEPSASGINQRIFIIEGNGREWNGTYYVNTYNSRSIDEWDGAKSIALLPWSVLTAEDEKELTERGRIYSQYAGIYHVYNKDEGGRAMVDHSRGGGRGTAGGGRGNTGGGWRNNGGGWGNNGDGPDWEHSGNGWENTGNNDAANNQDNKENGPDLYDEGTRAELPEDELFMLPTMVPGFMLRTKKWVSMHILSLEPVKFDRYAWDHLVLDPDTKLLIRSLVDVTCKGTARNLVQDVVTGKGGGLVTVLHGKPGTGKTLTVEAVAEHLERPIYIVGSEELPLDAPNFEASLKGILNLSSRWNAVLLIDEADVFLEQRSMHELARNAVVSVALRLLEYHSGVLFLTTNRIQAFDEAFLSRFSIGIRYPDLDQSSRLKIWKSFLHMARVEILHNEADLANLAMDGKSHVLAKDLEELAAIPFNGRSIKNLLRTSQALALANNTPLAIEHLRVVVKTSQRFLRDFEEIEGPGA